MGQFKFHTSCHNCNSSDALAVYEEPDGSFNGHCFSCGKYAGDLDPDSLEPVQINPNYEREYTRMTAQETFIEAIPDRKIDKRTAEKYGVSITKNEAGDILTHQYPYYNASGIRTAVHTRICSTKEFPWSGKYRECTLFGQQLLPPGGKYVTIFEGELDAMSYYQMTGYVGLSVKSANVAINDFKQNFEYLDSFDTIVIAFDKDEVKVKPDGTEFYPGQEAAIQCASLFQSGKVKIMDMGDLKDANDFLMAGRKDEFISLWWNARRYTPEGIVALENMWDILKERQEHKSVLYPWAGLNELTYGMRTKELITICGGTGMGKTTLLREIELALLENSEENIGLLKLEESVRDTALGIMSAQAGIPFHLPDTEYNEEELRSAFDSTLGSGRYFAYDSFGSNSIDAIVGRVRYMARALGCKYIILDHISIVVADQQNGDERKALDSITENLKRLTMELDICLIMVCHLRRGSGTPHEEGGQVSLQDLRGTQGIAQMSNMVFGIERNSQADDPEVANTTTIRVLKNRFCGRLGVATQLYYDKNTTRLKEKTAKFDAERAKFKDLEAV